MRRIEKPVLIILTDADKSTEGIVLAVGPGKRNSDGKRIPLDVKPGDKIRFNSKWNDLSSADYHHQLPLGADPEIHLIQEADIFGKVDG